MSLYPEARFITSAARAAQFVPDQGREVAFAGRSNAGKSSAINAIVGHHEYAFDRDDHVARSPRAWLYRATESHQCIARAREYVDG